MNFMLLELLLENRPPRPTSDFPPSPGAHSSPFQPYLHFAKSHHGLFKKEKTMKSISLSSALFFIALISSPAANALTFPSCTDYRGMPVKVKHTSSQMEGPAYSTWDKNGQPEIVFNAHWMHEIAHSDAMRMFVYEHECGHHVLGHVNPADAKHGHGEMKNELAADCYAAEQMRNQGYSINDILAVVDDVYPWPKDPEHPSGPVRSKHLEACYSNP